MTAVVVGGGIAGLAAAWELRKARPSDDIVVIEASDRVGGKIRTTEFAGRAVDEGADAFLARVPYAVDLAREIGLGDELTSPATGQASLWIGGVLKPIPAGHVLGVPVDIDLVAKSGILSDAGIARARQEPDVPGSALAPGEDVAVGALVAARYGREVQELLVDPLLGGINAGRSDELSIDVGAAQIAAAARRDASLTRALAAMRAENPPDPSAPVFWAPRGGMQRFVDALVAALRAKDVDVRTSAAVSSLDELDDLGADRIVLTAPAFESARLLRDRSLRAAEILGAIDYASVALVTLAYRKADLREPLTGSGILVPRVEGRFITAASVFSNKWPALAGSELVIIRASAGHIGDARPAMLDDAELAARTDEEVRAAFAIAGGPVAVRISRWPQAFPQFRPGHLDRIRALEAALASDAPKLAMAGAAVKGVGIPACILSAREAVERVCS